MLKFHLVTLFPEACDAYLNASIIGRARKEKKIKVDYQNPRDFVENKWGKVDERPYGGGPGMVMTALPVIKAVEKALNAKNAKGRPWQTWQTWQNLAEALALATHAAGGLLLCVDNFGRVVGRSGI